MNMNPIPVTQKCILESAQQMLFTVGRPCIEINQLEILCYWSLMLQDAVNQSSSEKRLRWYKRRCKGSRKRLEGNKQISKKFFEWIVVKTNLQNSN